MNISYEYYRVFYYAAKYKNLTKAADALYSNQPNVSRTIRLLEQALGCRLLIRSNRGISLTGEGQLLYSHVKVAVEQILAAEEELTRSTTLQKGSVTIGASESALRMLVLPALSVFRKSYPEIRIRILNHLTSQAIDSVKKGQVDFSVVATPAVIDASLLSHPVMEFQDILIGGPSCKELADTPISLQKTTSYPLVCLSEGTMTYQFYEKFYREHGLAIKPDLESATTDQILPMIKNDLGIGFVPEIFAREALQNGDVYRLFLEEEIPERQICLIENREYPLSIAAAELKNLLFKTSAADND